ncbi:hypothetical protein Cgig2_015647 [Carnegiea gigantea]|uniref:Cationic amino acid transporter C-terminal domain-containing protein n=1 Tax=Carnegiea gigantea TaxID=171969 RepID=A0A9Q1K1U6_9CARY|nr:hypothetical protein Cgig2_015647 [Carnegiea gigantea]
MGCEVGNLFRCLVRRKQVDSVHGGSSASGQPQLARALSVPHITAIGIGTTIGAGIYILVGAVAREYSGPALTLSFFFAGIAAGLSAFCYAELASRCPSAGSAYHYAYVCAGEGVAWLIGWSLMLEYTIGGSAIARGISPNLAVLFGSVDSLPSFLARQYILALGVTLDPCAAILIIIVTLLLCLGIKESAFAETIVTVGNVCAMLFVIIAGGYLGFRTGWVGYELSGGFLPFGINGMLAGSATVFFSYIGFDAVASTAEEVKNPQRDLPLGIAFALLICCALYMLVSLVLVGLVPYYDLDPDTPITSAFSRHGMQWAANTHQSVVLRVNWLPLKPRVLMAMARDGLLPPFFSDVNPRTQVPVKGTVATGAFAAALAFIMDVSELAGMVSVGALLAFTMVAICVLIVRYVPPDEVPLLSSLQESTSVVSLQCSGSTGEVDQVNPEKRVGTSDDVTQPLIHRGSLSAGNPVIFKKSAECNISSDDKKRRIIAGCTIMLTCLGAILLTTGASNVGLPRMNMDNLWDLMSLCLFIVPNLIPLSVYSIISYMVSAVGASIFVSGLIVLFCINQDDGRHSFGHSGGFNCPFIPLLPVASILINVYLLVNLG